MKHHMRPTALDQIGVDLAPGDIGPIAVIFLLRLQIFSGLVDLDGEQKRVILEALQVHETRVLEVQLHVGLA